MNIEQRLEAIEARLASLEAAQHDHSHSHEETDAQKATRAIAAEIAVSAAKRAEQMKARAK